jgi:hypothetical protein
VPGWFDLAIFCLCDIVGDMARKRKPRPHNRGWLLLKELLASGKLNQKALATKTGIPQSVISDLLNLWKLPNRIHALAFAEHDIPVDAWDETLTKAELKRLGVETGRAA